MLSVYTIIHIKCNGAFRKNQQMIKWIHKLMKNSGMTPSISMKLGSQLYVLVFPKYKIQIHAFFTVSYKIIKTLSHRLPAGSLLANRMG